MSDYRHKYTLTVTATIGVNKKLNKKILADLIKDEWNLEPATDHLTKWPNFNASKPEIDILVRYKKFDIKVD